MLVYKRVFLEKHIPAMPTHDRRYGDTAPDWPVMTPLQPSAIREHEHLCRKDGFTAKLSCRFT